jgi:hypothetical protein
MTQPNGLPGRLLAVVALRMDWNSIESNCREAPAKKNSARRLRNESGRDAVSFN